MTPPPFSKPTEPATREAITAVVLAGGQGRRLGGLDKGLQPLAGQPLIAHVIERLTLQVGAICISANRHAERYAAFGVPVFSDQEAGFLGPLAGVQAALARCTTPWLLCVPCDVPRLPADLAVRLFDAAMESSASGAQAQTLCEGALQAQPVFALWQTRLLPALDAFLARGERSAWRFAQAQAFVGVHFDDPRAFIGANTPEELAQLEQSWR